MATIADILLEKGRVNAELRRQQGAGRAQMIGQLFQVPGAIMQDRAAQHAAEAAAQQAAEDRRLKNDALMASTENTRVTAAKGLGELQAADEQKAHAERVRQVFAAPGVIDQATGKPDFEKALATAAQMGVDPLEVVTAINTTLSDYAKRVKAEMDAQPAQPTLIQRDPTKDLTNPVTGEVVSAGTPEVKQDTRALNVQLADAIKVGDMQRASQISRAIRMAAEAGREPAKPEDPLARRKRELELKKLEQEMAGGAVNLTGAQKDELALMDTVAGMGNQIMADGLKHNWAGVGGLGSGSIQQWMAKNFGSGTKEEQSLRNLIGNVKSTIAKLRGGTALTPQELALIDTYTPTINDSPPMIQSKVTSLNDFIKTKKAALLKIARGDYSDPAPNGPPSPGGRSTIGRFEVEVTP